MIMALNKLKLQVKPETQICSRYVDFLLEDKVVIECDGDYHFNMHRMEYTEET